ncbi:MAG: hypothetical protein K6E29_05070 [Cyanobacteria bacterium RUI128]|nr:hypothetical protein [Cyanobacteria bacterium RUI128]
MGLSSSQARLLNLTARMHQIEYKAAKLEAQKLQMANESRRVYDEYLDALDKTKVQVKTLNNDGSASYKDIYSYQDFLNAGYALEYKGRIYRGNVYEFYIPAENVGVPGGSAQPFIDEGYSISPGPYYFSEQTATGTYGQVGWFTYTDMYGAKFIAGGLPSFTYTNVISEGGFKDLANDAYGANYTTEPTGETFEEIITNLINSGDVTIVRLKDDSETSVAIDTGLQEVSDETLLRKAEAKYEADMRKIDAKDRKYDIDLAALDAERNAIKSEMETLKTVAKDNVERTFKLFS